MSYYAKSKVKHPHALHAAARAKERYDIDPTIITKLERGIRSQKLIVRSCRQSKTRIVHQLELDGKVYYVVYSKATKHIVTFLTPEMTNQYFVSIF